MSPRLQRSLFASAALSLCSIAGVAHGQAFYLQEQSVRGAGRAFSGEAADTGAASIWWNPAAIGGLEQGDAVIGVSAILPRGNVVDTGTVIRRPGQAFAPVGGDAVARNPIENGVLPSGAIAYPLGDRVAIGLAVAAPYSFTTDYDATSWTRYSATRTRLRTYDIQPSIGVAVTDWLRVGGSVNVEYADASLANALPNLSPLLADGSQTLKGDGWDMGWGAGVQFHNDVATVGIAYKSRIKHTLNGEVAVAGLLGPLAAQNRTVSDVSAEFYTPSQLIVGARFRLNEAVTLNAQAISYGWSDFDAIRLGAPLNVALPENYEDSWSLAGGVDYQVSPAVTLRAGVQHATTPTNDAERDARVPDANRWNVGGGASLRLTSGFTIDAAANYVDFDNASINRPTAAYAGTAVQTPVLTSGGLRDAHALVFSLGGRLRF